MELVRVYFGLPEYLELAPLQAGEPEPVAVAIEEETKDAHD